MPFYPRPTAWTQQPQSAVGIARTSLAWALEHFWGASPGGRVLRDAAGVSNGAFGQGTSGTSGNQWRVFGPQWYVNCDDTGTGTPNSAILSAGNAAGPSGNVFTFLARIRYVSNGANPSTIFCGAASSLSVRITSGGKIELLKAATASIGVSATTLTSGVEYDIGVSYDGTTARFYLNGVADGTATSSQTFTHAAYTFFAFTVASTERAPNGTRLYWCGIWSRVLSAPEVAAAVANPWQLCEPRKLWLPQVQPPPVLSAATLTSIGTTTARPQVTLTF